MPIAEVILIAVFAIVPLAFALLSLSRAYRSAGWPTATGTMTRSRVQVFSPLTNGSKVSSRWMMEIEYRYQVGGKAYTGWRVHFGSAPGLAFSRRLVARFPLHSSVAVRHHPAQPALSVLLPGASGYAWSSLLLSPAFALVGEIVYQIVSRAV